MVWRKELGFLSLWLTLGNLGLVMASFWASFFYIHKIRGVLWNTLLVLKSIDSAPLMVSPVWKFLNFS